jgi:low affinity Fe/Cu permease
MEYLPLYLAGFGILVLSLIGLAYLQNERLKKKLIMQAKEMLREGTSLEATHATLVNQKLEASQAAKIIEYAQQGIYVEDALEQLNLGKTQDEVKTHMVSRGALPEPADEAVSTAVFHKFCQDRPVVSMLLGIVLPLIGLAVMAGGLFLWYGNKGRFVTFPYSGHFVIAIGVVIVVLGGRFFLRSLSS